MQSSSNQQLLHSQPPKLEIHNPGCLKHGKHRSRTHAVLNKISMVRERDQLRSCIPCQCKQACMDVQAEAADHDDDHQQPPVEPVQQLISGEVQEKVLQLYGQLGEILPLQDYMWVTGHADWTAAARSYVARKLTAMESERSRAETAAAAATEKDAATAAAAATKELAEAIIKVDLPVAAVPRFLGKQGISIRPFARENHLSFVHLMTADGRQAGVGDYVTAVLVRGRDLSLEALQTIERNLEALAKVARAKAFRASMEKVRPPSPLHRGGRGRQLIRGRGRRV